MGMGFSENGGFGLPAWFIKTLAYAIFIGAGFFSLALAVRNHEASARAIERGLDRVAWHQCGLLGLHGVMPDIICADLILRFGVPPGYGRIHPPIVQEE